MADIKAGSPKTSESDSRAAKEWQDTGPSFEGLVRARDARRTQISAFEKDQHAIGVVSLGDAIEWLEERDEKLLVKRVGKIWRALSSDRSMFQIGGKLLPSVMIVHEDSWPPVQPFNSSDMASARKNKTYDDARAQRVLIERFWALRDILRRLFQQNDLPLPPFWIDAPSTARAAKKAPAVRGKRGAKPVIEWKHDIYPFMQTLLQQRGDFDDSGQVDGWRAQADMERAVSDYISETLDKMPVESTIRHWVSKFMGELRAEHASAKADK